MIRLYLEQLVKLARQDTCVHIYTLGKPGSSCIFSWEKTNNRCGAIGLATIHLHLTNEYFRKYNCRQCSYAKCRTDLRHIALWEPVLHPIMHSHVARGSLHSMQSRFATWICHATSQRHAKRILSRLRSINVAWIGLLWYWKKNNGWVQLERALHGLLQHARSTIDHLTTSELLHYNITIHSMYVNTSLQ